MIQDVPHTPISRPARPKSASARHLKKDASLLAVLTPFRTRPGYIPADVIGPACSAMSLSRAEVHGVITYYHHFRLEPPARRDRELCRARPAGAWERKALAAHIEGHTGMQVRFRSPA